MKPGNYQRSKQRCQDLLWKVHNRVQSFVLGSYTMHELHNQNHLSAVVCLRFRGRSHEVLLPTPKLWATNNFALKQSVKTDIEVCFYRCPYLLNIILEWFSHSPTVRFGYFVCMLHKAWVTASTTSLVTKLVCYGCRLASLELTKDKKILLLHRSVRPLNPQIRDRT